MLSQSQFTRTIPYLVEGIVVDNNDPDQMGRLKVWCPAVDGETYDIPTLPWAEYVSPLVGTTTDYPVGREYSQRAGVTSYGFWAIPKVNAIVLIGFLQGDPNRRYFLGSVPALHANRSLPRGRNNNPDSGQPGPWTDTYDNQEPAYTNLRSHFSGNVIASEAQTRGVYERMAAEPKTGKTGKEGYGPNVTGSGYDSHTYCFTTPGGHSLIMQDNPEWCRTRIVTTAGNQIILDDSNERIYISTARGGTWVELDEDGRIHMYAADSFSVSAKGDINFTTGAKFNVEAAEGINLRTPGTINLDNDSTINMTSAGDIKLTSCGTLHLLASGNIVESAGAIHLNSQKAEVASPAEPTSVKPAHEPWQRPNSKLKRNTNWKP